MASSNTVAATKEQGSIINTQTQQRHSPYTAVIQEPEDDSQSREDKDDGCCREEEQGYMQSLPVRRSSKIGDEDASLRRWC